MSRSALARGHYGPCRLSCMPLCPPSPIVPDAALPLNAPTPRPLRLASMCSAATRMTSSPRRSSAAWQGPCGGIRSGVSVCTRPNPFTPALSRGEVGTCLCLMYISYPHRRVNHYSTDRCAMFSLPATDSRVACSDICKLQAVRFVSVGLVMWPELPPPPRPSATHCQWII